MIFYVTLKTRLLALAIIILSVTGGLSHAQQNAGGYLGQGKDQYSVFVFGDALAGGLWAGTARITNGNARLIINGRYRDGSGLAKPNIYNWAQRLPVTLENRQVDIALVFIGTNDGQDIRYQGAYLTFNSLQWRKVYTASVATMMTQLTAHKTAVYWLEVPPVNRPDLDERLKIIAAIHKQQAAKYGIRFIEIRKLFTTPEGQYTQNGADIDGNFARLRSRNGIRFIKAGNNKLASIVLGQVLRDVAIADGERPVADFPLPDGAQIAANANSTYTGPIFGSPAPDNQVSIIEPRNMPLAGSDQSNNVLVSLPTFGSKNTGTANTTSFTGNSALNILKAQTSPDSTAYDLFNKGNWPKTRPDRLDDFHQ